MRTFSLIEKITIGLHFVVAFVASALVAVFPLAILMMIIYNCGLDACTPQASALIQFQQPFIKFLLLGIAAILCASFSFWYARRYARRLNTSAPLVLSRKEIAIAFMVVVVAAGLLYLVIISAGMETTSTIYPAK